MTLVSCQAVHERAPASSCVAFSRRASLLSEPIIPLRRGRMNFHLNDRVNIHAAARARSVFNEIERFSRVGKKTRQRERNPLRGFDTDSGTISNNLIGTRRDLIHALGLGFSNSPCNFSIVSFFSLLLISYQFAGTAITDSFYFSYIG
jgi:hypothetical protein